MAAVVDAPARNDLQPLEQRLRLGAAVRFDHGYNYIDVFALPPLRRLQHLVGFADAGCGAQENLETATLLAGRLFEQRFR